MINICGNISHKCQFDPQSNMSESLREYIQRQRCKKDILLMTHIVIGYPNIKSCFNLVNEMVNSGADIIELQIPCTNAHLDGDTIRKANDLSIASGVDTGQCFEFAATLTRTFPVPFVFVAYYETVKHFGLGRFFAKTRRANIQAVIIPDMPKSRRNQLHQLANNHGVSIIPVIFPATSLTDMIALLDNTNFCYCAAHNGVTGESVQFEESIAHYLDTVRREIRQPLAIGFGIKNKTHIEFFKGQADIAVIGTRILQIMESFGISAVGRFLQGLTSTQDILNTSKASQTIRSDTYTPQNSVNDILV